MKTGLIEMSHLRKEGEARLPAQQLLSQNDCKSLPTPQKQRRHLYSVLKQALTFTFDFSNTWSAGIGPRASHRRARQALGDSGKNSIALSLTAKPPAPPKQAEHNSETQP